MNYKWNLSDLKNIKKNGLKVFSCFACGGGSSMGYKLSGYTVLGCNEIDKKMMDIYKENLKPKYSFLEGIQNFKDREDLPEELYNLDILDGSPPCSNFSMAGKREEDWGKEKVFREGQALQVLDTLFFDFIDLAKKLQPKVIIAENVKGILLGEAITYVQKIIKGFEEAGYYTHCWLLDASKMGVPQRRQRVFFISIRKDIAEKIEGTKQSLFSKMPYLDLLFEEKEIPYKEIECEDNSKGRHIPLGILPYWEKILPGRSCADVHEKGHYFQELKLHPDKALPTLRAGSNSYYHYIKPRRLHDTEIKLGGSFPLDYNFLKTQPIYIIGMSVPPLMIAKISQRIKEQWFDKIKN
jgi:DNA (cytosine-5)-methyltransferase 1